MAREFKCIEITGKTNYERGFQHGSAAKEHILFGLENYHQRFAGKWELAQEKAKKYIDYLTADYSDLLEEVRGIGDGAGIDFIRHYGRETVFHRDKQHILHLFDGLQQVKNCVLYLDYRKLSTFSPAISFNLKNIPSEIVAENLAQKHIFVRAGLHCAPLAHGTARTLESGTVRCSVSPFNTSEEIRKAAALMEQLL